MSPPSIASSLRSEPSPATGWHCVAFSDGVAGFADSDELEDLFIEAFMAAGEPLDMAVFGLRDPMSGWVVHWFSPAAHALASQFEAASCDKPSAFCGMTLLLGDIAAWELLFAGEPGVPPPGDRSLRLVPPTPQACCVRTPASRARKHADAG